MSEFWQSAERGDLANVKHQIEAGANVNAAGLFDMSPLHVSIRKKHTSVTEFLISLPQCDLQARDLLGSTPLHVACIHHSGINIVKLLVQAAVDINAANDMGETPLHVAMRNIHHQWQTTSYPFHSVTCRPGTVKEGHHCMWPAIITRILTL